MKCNRAALLVMLYSSSLCSGRLYFCSFIVSSGVLQVACKASRKTSAKASSLLIVCLNFVWPLLHLCLVFDSPLSGFSFIFARHLLHHCQVCFTSARHPLHLCEVLPHLARHLLHLCQSSSSPLPGICLTSAGICFIFAFASSLSGFFYLSQAFASPLPGIFL
jgi:hypothetical protein